MIGRRRDISKNEQQLVSLDAGGADRQYQVPTVLGTSTVLYVQYRYLVGPTVSVSLLYVSTGRN